MRARPVRSIFLGIAAALLAGCPDEGGRKIGDTCSDSSECESGLCAGGVCLDPEADDDGDTLPNGVEALILGSDPLRADSDDDGADDSSEAEFVDGTWLARDSDGDGKPDWYESRLLDADQDCVVDQLDADDGVTDSNDALIAQHCPQTGVCIAADATLAVRCEALDTPVCVFGGVPGYEAVEVSCDELDNDCDGGADNIDGCSSAPTGLAARPDAVTLPVGRTAAVTLEATFDDQSSRDVTLEAQWASDDETIVTVVDGTLTGVAIGSAMVTGTFETMSAQVAVAVGAPVVDVLTLSADTETVAVGFTVTLTAEATWSDGARTEVTDTAEWSTDDPAVATVVGGVVTGVSEGQATIAAAFEGQQASRVLSVLADGCAGTPCANGGECEVNATGGFVCECADGWQGSTCTVDVDECADSPGCDMNATCVNTDGGFNCVCNTGWVGTGTFCANVNECLEGSAQCHQLADCIDTNGSYECVCRDGFQGDGVTTCDDIDECDAGAAGCHENANCINAAGGVSCVCKSGFIGDGTTICANVDECAQGTDDCHDDATCEDTIGSYGCTCDPGFSGDGVTACDDVDECDLGTAGCDVNADCTNTDGGAVCTCRDGWAGDGESCNNVDECQQAADECLPLATCQDTQGGYDCICDAGYEGDGLSTCADIDECADGVDTCSDNAGCTNTVGSYRCSCNDGWDGDGFTCLNVDECAEDLDDCHADADCGDTDGGYECTCKSGFSGDGITCTNIDDCASEPCTNGGTCVDGINDFTCSCPTGYAGELCEINVDGCEDAPCQNGGDCLDGVDPPFTCDCPAGYTGSLCELNVDECKLQTDTCDDNAECEDTDGSYTCTCRSGWDGDGETCTNVDECQLDLDNCADNASCSDTPGDFECECNAGYAGNGVVCSNVDECQQQTDSCDDNADCMDTAGSYTCTCRSGYSGDGETCTNIDECADELDTCSDDADCQDTDGGYFCTCTQGFVGDGETCTNIDECADGLDNCSSNARCDDTAGSFECTCDAGYSGDGVTCDDIDECATGAHDCHANANCNNTDGGFSCTCKAGTWGPGTTCTNCTPVTACVGNVTCSTATDSVCDACDSGYTLNTQGQCDDVDECAEDTDTCTSVQTCANTTGGFNCTDCDAGYWNDPDDGEETCVDIDECSAGDHDCDDNASCTNTVGAFECACDAGFYGDGNSCTACTAVANCEVGAVTCSSASDSKCASCVSGYQVTAEGTCADIDECSPADDNGRCELPGEICANTAGSFDCTACDTGFENDPDDGLEACVDIDECATGGHDCSADASCVNTTGGWTCTCDDGYYSTATACSACTDIPGCTTGKLRCTTDEDQWCLGCDSGWALDANTGLCDDVDECALNTDNCTSAQRCDNEDGGFSCVDCSPGYEADEDGTACVDIDECATGEHDCTAGGVCRNTAGSFACDCYPGFAESDCGTEVERSLYVDDDAAAGGDGSQATPYQHPSEIPAVLGSLVTVRIAEGTYTGNGSSAVLVARTDVDYLGGYPQGQWVTRTPNETPSVLDGLGAGARVVTAQTDSVIDGFWITGGKAQRGAGVYGANAQLGITIRDCQIYGNEGVPAGPGDLTEGGGVYLAGDGGKIYDSEIYDNSADYGGGVGMPTVVGGYIENTLIHHNTASTNGGGLRVRAGTLTVVDSHIYVNSAGNRGGGVSLTSSNATTFQESSVNDNAAAIGGGIATKIDVVLYGRNLAAAYNEATTRGGNLFVEDSELNVRYATFAHGTAPNAGQNVDFDGPDAAQSWIRSSILWQSGGAEHIYVNGNLWLEDTTYAPSDAAFVNFTGNNTNNPWLLGDLTLWSHSPAIDSTDLSAGGIDIRGRARGPAPWNPGTELPNDRGAYEWSDAEPRDATVWRVDALADGAGNGYIWPDAFTGLDAALAVASAPDVVWIAGSANGLSYEPDTTDGFVIPDGVSIWGGFPTGDDDAGFAQRNTSLFTTRLRCDVETPCDHVVQLGQGNWVNGFQISGGDAPDGENGGGIYGVDVGDLHLARLVITGNKGRLGGGVYLNGSTSVDIQDVDISFNEAGHRGGGLYLESHVGVTMSNVTLQENTAPNNGGGAFFSNLDGLTWSGGYLEQNVAGGHGGGLHVWDSPGLVFEDVDFLSNQAGDLGGGFRINAPAASANDATFYLCTLSGNQSQRGGAFNSVPDTVVNLDRCIIKGNGVTGLLANGKGLGGAFMSGGTVKTINTLFHSNTATSGAWVGYVIAGGTTELDWTTVVQTGDNGPFAFIVDGTLDAANSIIWGPSQTGGQISVGPDGTADLTDSIVRGAAAECGVNWSCTGTVISQDPRFFIGAPSEPDYMISYDSPAANRTILISPFSPDLAGTNQRPYVKAGDETQPPYDWGCYESQGTEFGLAQ